MKVVTSSDGSSRLPALFNFLKLSTVTRLFGSRHLARGSFNAFGHEFLTEYVTRRAILSWKLHAPFPIVPCLIGWLRFEYAPDEGNLNPG